MDSSNPAISRLDSLIYLTANLRMALLSQLFFFSFSGTEDTFQDVWFRNTLACCHPLHKLCNRLSCACTQLNMGFLLHWGIRCMGMSLSEEHCWLRKNEDEDHTCQTTWWLRGWLAVGLKKANVTAMKSVLWSSEKLMSNLWVQIVSWALTSFSGTGGGTVGSHLLDKALPLGYALNPGLGCLMEAMAL